MGDVEKYFVHESSYIDGAVEIGEETKIWHFSHILTGTVLGKGCTIGQNVVIGPHVKVGNNCKIQNNVSVYKGVELEDDVFCGPSMVFTNVINPRAFIERKEEFRNTLVKRGASLGANCTIICGNSIGRYAMVAAGAVVTGDVRDFALVSGIPARHSGWVCKCGRTLNVDNEDDKIKCIECGEQYSIENGQMLEVE